MTPSAPRLALGRIALLAAALASNALATEDPAKLLRGAAERRAAWVKGAVEFTWDSATQRDTRFYSAQFTRQERLLTLHGDAEGVVHRYPSGRPAPYKSSPFGPVYTLDTPDAIWEVQDMALNASMWRRTTPGSTLDVRSLGMTPAMPLAGPTDELALVAKARHVGQQDGLQVVAADAAEGRVTWWIDAQRGGLPVRVRFEKGGALVTESRSELGQFAGEWFPARVEYYEAGYMNGVTPRHVINVSDARFDAADLPDRIRLEDIGVDAGINVFAGEQGQAGSGQSYKWDGRALATLEEYTDRWNRGELRSGPIFQRNWQRAQTLTAENKARYLAERGPAAAPSPDSPAPAGAAAAPAPGESPSPPGAQPVELRPVPDWESEWERYVREFCERYGLNRDQRAHADRLLDSCKKLGHGYVARRRFAFGGCERARQRLWELDPAEQAARRVQGDRQRLALILPLREIFDERLKPGLEKLPTREQRKAAEAGQTAAPKTP